MDSGQPDGGAAPPPDAKQPAYHGVPPGEEPWAPRHQKSKEDDEGDVTAAL